MKLYTKDIILDPHPLLRAKAQEVKIPLTKADRKTALSLLDYVKRSRDPEIAEKEALKPASGLAAPQIAVSKRMFAVVIDEEEEDGTITEVDLILANPKIISESVKQTALSQGEGCLSIETEHPGLVYRPNKIKMRAYDVLADEEVVLTVEGYLAIVLQHELDHLNGILFYDRISQNDPWESKTNSIIIE